MDHSSLSQKLENQKDELLRLVKKAKASGIENVEIFSSFGYSEDVSLEKNDLNTCTATEENMFGIRVIDSGHQGFIISNHLPSLFDSIKEAQALAKSQSTPDYDLCLPEPEELTPVTGKYDTNIDQLGIETLVEIAKTSLEWRKDQFVLVNIDS
nr:TldD/PmbA family protein [Leptospira sp.]